MIAAKINARPAAPMRTAELASTTVIPVTATPTVAVVAVGVGALVCGLGWAYGW